MTDLTAIKTGERVIEITHPASGEKVGLRFTIVHIDDEQLATVRRGIADERAHLEARGKYFKGEQIDNNRRALMFAAMKGWEWYNPTGSEGDEGYRADAMPSFEGNQPDFTKRNVYAVLKGLSWIEPQIAEPMGDIKGFFDASEMS